jgi:hypothetical protein
MARVHPSAEVPPPATYAVHQQQQPPPAPVHTAQAAAAAAGQPQAPGVQSLNQTAEFFLSNYRLGKTLGIGSFGKVG